MRPFRKAGGRERRCRSWIARARLEPISGESRTSLSERRQFVPGKSWAKPETGLAFLASLADSGRQRPRYLASPATKPRNVSNRQANDYWRWKIDYVERVASVREPEHLLLTRPCDRCIEKAGDTDADRHADLAAVRAPRIIGRGRAGAHSDLTGSSGVMERASLRLARTRPCTSPVRRTPGTVESAEACRQPLARLPSCEVALVKRLVISPLRVAAEKISTQVRERCRSARPLTSPYAGNAR
jgi:hypothetical protein